MTARATSTGRRLYLTYPALLAVAPVLNQQAQNPGLAPADALAVGAALAAVVALVQVACWAALRWAARRSAARRPGAARSTGVRPTADAADQAAVAAAAFVLALYGAPPASDWAHATLGRAYPLAVVAATATAVALAAAARLAIRARPSAPLAPAGRFVARVTLLVVGWSAARIAVAPVRLAGILRGSALVRDLARPVPFGPPAAPGPPRDIYVLVLDEYPGAGVLRDLYGISNAPFLDSLHALGFHTPAVVRSNYAVTLMSVGSLLNLADLRPLAAELPAGYRDYAVGAHLLAHNRAARLARARGYRFAFFPSAWYVPTRHNPEADFEHAPRASATPAAFVHRSELATGWANATLFRRALRYLPTPQAAWAAHAERTFAGVAALAGRPAGGPPVFAVAHVLMPHNPFIVDAACRPYPRDTPLRDHVPPSDPATRAALAAQLGCVNREVLATVRALLARLGPRPVIVLQGDHGPHGLAPFETPPDSLTPAQIRERFTPLGAYYLPDGGAAAMGDTVSVVNVLRTVFRHYLGAALPPLPNAIAFSHWATPYRLTEIDTLTLHPAAPRRPRPATSSTAP